MIAGQATCEQRMAIANDVVRHDVVPEELKHAALGLEANYLVGGR